MSENESDDRGDELPFDETAPGEPGKVLRARELFGASREIWIDLDGVRYRLRITRRGKLILQK